MGNMGYPVVTRLGINQFWYSHWYNSYSYNLSLKQVRIVVHLLKVYLSYGVTFLNNIYLHKYFFNFKYKKQSFNNNYKFFRQYFYSNTLLNISHSYYLRYKTSEYFSGKFWIIKYSNWIIICFYCFKPQKQKLVKKNQDKKELYSINSKKSYFSKILKNRFKLIYSFLIKYYKKSSIYSF